MAASVDEFWRGCLDDLATRLPSQSMETWFRPILPRDLGGGRLRLEVPSQFFVDWLAQHYQPLLEQVVQSRAGARVDVVLEVGADAPPAESPSSMPPVSVPSRRSGPELVAETIALNPRFIFDTFVVGNSNQFAYAASNAVAEAPGKTAFNPLVIYGGVGLGKTHLLQAIAWYAIQNGTARSVLYVSSEKFISDFINSIQNNKTSEFSTTYRNVDLLLVDDIQFFSNKERTQEEFFHTFNTLHQRGKQIVLTCDRLPRELRGLEERLISRFLWGLVTDIQPPDLETRVAILQKKADTDGVSVPNDVLLYIAQNIKSNIRDLEGCLIKLLAYSSLTGSEISTDMAHEVLHDLIHVSRRSVTIESVQETVADHFNIDSDLLRARTRKKEIVVPRQVAMYLSKLLTESSLKTVGLHFGGRDHSTVLHAFQTVQEKCVAGSKLRTDMEAILLRLDIEPRSVL
jgi:chromosomal replication initiator protein